MSIDFRKGERECSYRGALEFTLSHKKAQKAQIGLLLCALCAFLWLTLFERFQTFTKGFERKQGTLEASGFD
ncbi:MAG TPA: hypothetical protein VFP64_03985, partial [Pyrinomonadaceae bacterium]|nr:hypothetical protein [Pyrinomonadaceae bacterium]